MIECDILLMYRLSDDMKEEKRILRYLEGTASQNAQAEMLQWKSASSKNIKEFKRFKVMWETTLLLKNYVQFDLVKEWNLFQNYTSKKQGPINRNALSKQKSFSAENKIGDRAQNVKTLMVTNNQLLAKKRPWRITMGVAATFLILVAASLFMWPRYQYIDIVNAEEKMERKLSDGSVVKISQGASLKTLRFYSFVGERRVKISGEVNFDIAKDENKPFIVDTEKTAIRVLGTKFNIISSGIEAEVANEEGLIRFFEKANPANGVELEEGDRIKYDGSGFIDLNEPEVIPEPKPIPEVGDVMQYLKNSFGTKITFGSEMHSLDRTEIQIDYDGKSAAEIIELLQEKAIVSYTSSCTGCYHINEIIVYKD